MQVWGLVGRLTLPPSSSGKARKGSRRIPAADARLSKGSVNNRGRFVHNNRRMDNTLSVVVEKPAGLRRQWIAWPRGKSRDDPYEAIVPLLHISHYLPPVMAEAASCLDVKASFFPSLFTAGDSASLSMPRGGRHAGGADTTFNGIQGQPRNSPDYYYLGNRGGDDGGSPLWAAPPMVRIEVWIDNIRITGSKSDVTLWEAQVLRNADSCHAYLGGTANRALRNTLFWGYDLIKLTVRYP
ncbi:hypothetical protein C3747_1g348 [Trypanosoma cruzi]|uniref:Target of rapamycin (TOR) kinase 1 n=1 Tax=Trypanosoma cruzi TaxID=5693 RepID=A0A2V2XN06_TRYCR|nr:hypothetical protein C3747_1g348 [Trypanosoma cruzi]RNC49713.1 target of rapamycin (TOR) kinase 1 [Trypanosoma cruzi]